MSDLIDRQQAIDKLRNNLAYMQAFGADRAVTLIEELPSAQPEPIRCKDCRQNYNCDIQYHAQAGNMFYCGAAERRTDECVD